MGYMHFKSPLLEKLFKRYKWTRNNTIELFEKAEEQHILAFASSSLLQKKYTFQSILFQFQCILTTTDTYYRKLTAHPNKSFGVFVMGDAVLKKEDLTKDLLKKQLKEQLVILQDLLKDFDDKKLEEFIDDITTISDHEYMHHGELILMFREAGAQLPERLQKAWAL